jgi:putative ABC transport system permease protein
VNGSVSIRTSASQAAQTINAVKAEWTKFFPGNTVEYFFWMIISTSNIKLTSAWKGVWTFYKPCHIVACLGLFGLASFTTLQRTKEIGIRKVLGASVVNILRLLFSEFVLLLVIAFVIATPLAWLTTNNWLQVMPSALICIGVISCCLSLQLFSLH